ncbi:hypothetical protein SAMN05421809_0096 [Natronorubrum daqingense]|uniref:Uncharacterized protein n=1 Tax=Natronorubrum daqingense TaxID=588898 RepID=A0A1N6XF55_9EURY|nr:hypothetical protein SAMN05421809_0096 [Natronorubrum daqingense]
MKEHVLANSGKTVYLPNKGTNIFASILTRWKSSLYLNLI